MCQNQARNEAKNGEDTKDGEDTNPHQGDEPSPEKGENRAQKAAGGGSEGSEGSFQTFTGPPPLEKTGDDGDVGDPIHRPDRLQGPPTDNGKAAADRLREYERLSKKSREASKAAAKKEA
jgi:hypothetical protein